MFLVDQAGFIGPRPLPLRREKGVWKNLVALPYLLGTAEHHRNGHPGSGTAVTTQADGTSHTAGLHQGLGRQNLSSNWTCAVQEPPDR